LHKRYVQDLTLYGNCINNFIISAHVRHRRMPAPTPSWLVLPPSCMSWPELKSHEVWLAGIFRQAQMMILKPWCLRGYTLIPQI